MDHWLFGFPRINSWAEWSSSQKLAPATPAEKRLIDAVRKGDICGLGDERPTSPTEETKIRGALLAYILRGGCPKFRPTERGVRLTGAAVCSSLEIERATVRGSLYFSDCLFNGRIAGRDAVLSELHMPGCKTGSVDLQRAHISGSVILGQSFMSNVHVNLAGARIDGQLNCAGGHFGNGDGPALTVVSATIGRDVTLCNGFTAHGEVNFSGSRIEGRLDCCGASFQNLGGTALMAQNLHVARDFILRDTCKARGTVNLMDSTFVNGLDLRSTHLDTPENHALIASGIKAETVQIGAGFTAAGNVLFPGADIRREFYCTNARFASQGTAFFAEGLKVGGGFYWRDVQVMAGTIHMAGAQVRTLYDDVKCWPTFSNAGKKSGSRLDLDGFQYTHLEHKSGSLAARLEWAQAGAIWGGEFYPQPFQQLASVLRSMGHEKDAIAVQIKRHGLASTFERARCWREASGPMAIWALVSNALSWLWSLVLRLLTGFGYRPARAVWALLFLLGLTSFLADRAWNAGAMVPTGGITRSEAWIALAQDPNVTNPAAAWTANGAAGQDWEPFNAIAYAADIVVPIVEFGQTAAWRPSPAQGPWGDRLWWARWVLSALGWAVTALGAAAVTGIIRRD